MLGVRSSEGGGARAPETPPAPVGERGREHRYTELGTARWKSQGSHNSGYWEEGQGWVGRGGNDRNSVLISKVP